MAKNKPGSRAEQKAAAQARRTARQDRAAKAAEALKAQQKARKRQERLIVVGVIVAIVLIVGLVAWALSRSNDTSATSGPPDNVHDTYALAVGEEDAEHTVVIYEDFMCPACGAFEATVGEDLGQAVEDGTARVEYRPVEILGDYSMRAANALAVVLDTSGVEVAKEFHDILYAEQPSEGGGNAPDDDWLVEKAVEAGAEEDDVRPGIEDKSFEGWVERATDDFSKAGHTGTPTVLLDGEVIGGSTMGEVAQNLFAGLG